MFYGDDAYFNSGWNIMDGSLVSISIIDLLMSLVSDSSPRIFGILRVKLLASRSISSEMVKKTNSPLLLKNNLTGVPSTSFVTAVTSDKSSTRPQIGCSNTAFVTSADRKYCINLLYIFHYFWHTGRTIVQRNILLLRRRGNKTREK